MEYLVRTSVSGCRVINSSGCHRYAYWNEQHLFDGKRDTGWCTPSRATPTIEFLEVALPRTFPVNGVRLLSRSINGHAGFPVRFNVLARSGEKWAAALEARDIVGRIDCWHEWTFPAVCTDLLRLEFHEVNKRPEGKYFLQFMCLEVTADNAEEAMIQ